ncbi:glycosyltransferase [Limnohabitans sp. Rim8]|uniref:glycosyltransferase n=1 Tax=Limnohabitans sp. Rim8 TaxID=1100718 RepID=UPI00261D1149|nr:glycosyltransferase [Limnohabitans sp. Rim8]
MTTETTHRHTNKRYSATLFLLTYNQQNTVEAAAMSCLNQACEPIEIVFSDDCSSDGTLAKLHSMAAQYQGPHHVRVRQNHNNLGIADHYNQAVSEASAELIVVAAGDDLSAPNRVARVLEAWRASHGRLNLIASYATSIDRHGKDLGLIQTGHLEKWPDAKTWCKKRPYVIGATFAFHKKLFTVFGPLDNGVDYEDQVLSFRAATLGGGLTIPEPLVQYRQGGLSSRSVPNSAELLTHAHSKYRRQLAVYTQITKDLGTIGQSHLSRTKIARYIEKSNVVLELISKTSPSFSDLLHISVKYKKSPGIFWTLMRFFYIKYPRATVFFGKRI